MMRQISKKKRQITAEVSMAGVLVAVIVLAITNIGALTAYANEVFLAAVLVIIVPSAVLDYENQTVDFSD